MREGGVPVNVLELLVEAFLYGDELGRIVTCGWVTAIKNMYTTNDHTV